MPDRVYAQYRQHEPTRTWLGVIDGMADEIRSAALKVRKSYDIDLAQAHDLEILGTIVGAERSRYITVRYDDTISALEVPEFPNRQGAFLWVPPFYGGGVRFGDGSRYQNGEQIVQARILDLDDYREYVRSRILYNISDGTIDSVLSVARALTGVAADEIAMDNRPDQGRFFIVFYTEIPAAAGDILKFFNIVPAPPTSAYMGWYTAI